MADHDLVWRGVHVHRYVRQDEFLLEAVVPVLNSLRESAVLGRFFFLRYWQGGHHLRVRLLVPAGEADDVTAHVMARFRAYLAGDPDHAGLDVTAFHEAQSTMAGLEDAQTEDICPPDTVRLAPYPPELHKYGGARGVAIAESFFERSSDIVLALLGGRPSRPGRRLGAGFSMMVRGLRAATVAPDAMASFFAHYCLLWAPYVFDEFLVTWPDLLQERRESVGAHVRALLADAPAPTDAFAAAVGTAMAAVRADADEVLARVAIAGPQAPYPQREKALLASYLHTHNNRFGLIPQQEALLGYLGHHVLSDHLGVESAPDLIGRIRQTRRHRLGDLVTS